MYYDSVYKNDPDFCGTKPNNLLIKVVKKIKQGDNFLDLGCGQGRDSFYMAKQKFCVTALDSSFVAISQMNEKITKQKLKNIKAICKDITKFKIEPNKFSVIGTFGTLHFLKKSDSQKIIANAQENILPGGFVLITSFTENNSPSKRRKSHFKKGELKKLFKKPNFIIHHYLENTFIDSGHVGQLEPHKHGMVGIIAQRISR